MNGRGEIDNRSADETESEGQSAGVDRSVTRLSDYQGKRFEGGEGARDEEQGVHSSLTDRHLSRPGGQEATGGLLIMARELFEFYCEGGCHGYTTIPIDVEFDCHIIMVCPGCKHEHFRAVKDGKITGDRHSTMKDDSKVHRLEPTLAAFSKTKQLKESEPAKNDSKGFISSLWDRKKQT